ncbi:uncharacterized protein DNG_09473 [Cephalotrichum gorgonifer]|uniref:Uncharacterized protein n=1 Tax=Cephalotrichum gorgonifer TaxID=2041049 RepID=A0AAE8SZE0_9PEZI|nr:uncharacterized protein DNG_09473 [Cephalotrichum gorgonifer]
MAVPGVLMRLVEPRATTLASSDSTFVPPNVEATQFLEANDSQKPSQNAVYYLSDISPLLSTSSAYDEDVRAHGSELTSISWVVCSFINGRDGPHLGSGSDITSSSVEYTMSGPPATGSVVVINGSTPRPDKEQEYHDWYDQEHGEKLTLVPGWNSARRYRFEKSYGDVETANFYGFNYYDEKNGLGGPEWKAGVTEWTLRIRSNAAKPNIRRVWSVVSTSVP